MLTRKHACKNVHMYTHVQMRIYSVFSGLSLLYPSFYLYVIGYEFIDYPSHYDNQMCSRCSSVVDKNDVFFTVTKEKIIVTRVFVSSYCVRSYSLVASGVNIKIIISKEM